MSAGKTLARALVAGIGFTGGAIVTAYAIAEVGYRVVRRRIEAEDGRFADDNNGVPVKPLSGYEAMVAETFRNSGGHTCARGVAPNHPLATDSAHCAACEKDKAAE